MWLYLYICHFTYSSGLTREVRKCPFNYNILCWRKGIWQVSTMNFLIGFNRAWGKIICFCICHRGNFLVYSWVCYWVEVPVGKNTLKNFLRDKCRNKWVSSAILPCNCLIECKDIFILENGKKYTTKLTPKKLDLLYISNEQIIFICNEKERNYKYTPSWHSHVIKKGRTGCFSSP